MGIKHIGCLTTSPQREPQGCQTDRLLVSKQCILTLVIIDLYVAKRDPKVMKQPTDRLLVNSQYILPLVVIIDLYVPNTIPADDEI